MEDLESEFIKAHGLFLGLAIKVVLQALPKSELITVDDHTGNRDFDRRSRSPVVAGYRPDAIIKDISGTILIECKSDGDVDSPHSQNQYKRIEIILSEFLEVRFVLFCFGTARTPEEILRTLPGILSSSDRSQVVTTEMRWVEDYEVV